MTKQDFAKKLWVELKANNNVKDIVTQIKSAKINGKPLTIDEQLEIVDLIRGQQRNIFESVDAFLALVNQVETTIKSQSENASEVKNDGK